jgi:hypothetical protein
MRPLLAVLLLLPVVGAAQTLSIAVNGASSTGTGTTTSSSIAFNTCTNNVGGSWTGTSLTGACSTLQIWITAVGCGSTGAPTTGNVPADFVVYTAQSGDLAGGLTTDTFQFNFGSLPGFSITTADGGVSGNACGQPVDFTNTLCAGLTIKAADASCTGGAIQSNTVSLRYDNIPPDPPTVSIVPLDSQLSVRLAASATTSTADLNYFQVQYAVDNTADGGTPNYVAVCGNVAATNPACTISGLVNGENYLIQGFTVDEATNRSAASTPTPGSPVLTLGFYANYINDGGQVGGCGDSAGGAPSALAFATFLLVVLARRRG